MSKPTKRPSIQAYWTSRYLVTLIIGLFIIGFLAVLWIRQTTLSHNLDLTRVVVNEMADRVVSDTGDFNDGRRFSSILERRGEEFPIETRPLTYVVSSEGVVLFHQQGPGRRNEPGTETIPISLFENEEVKFKLNNGEAAYAVSSPIEEESKTIGHIVMIQREQDLLNTNQEYRLLFIMLAAIGLLGYGVIFYLAKQLSKPIRRVAFAAQQIEQGSYAISLPEDIEIKEEEISDLVDAFKTMSARLEHLEEMRSELLAGVSHDLKTPVTSISGLLQAVNEDVVTGAEAKEFIGISLKETARLQQMIESLLSFNSFAAGGIPIYPVNTKINPFVSQVFNQWVATLPDSQLIINVEKPLREIDSTIDPLKVEQILINLAQNAHQAIKADGRINVTIKEKDQTIEIYIKDNGSGISTEEQPFIFERFYRGNDKKLKVRGLGLGLSYSRMIARAHGGDLLLVESSKDGSIFCLRLPKAM
ncbi:MAG TPA: HAMP domain-containing sensor histidine kinase [Paenisporosarcina sp.]|nr:HAMP domain-containing sensor histidine kinase [Paenisporosarcina sp.]